MMLVHEEPNCKALVMDELTVRFKEVAIFQLWNTKSIGARVTDSND